MATVGVCVFRASALAGALFLLGGNTLNEDKITNEQVANALISLCESTNVCDEQTATGFKTSKKKNILKSNKEGSFAKFIGEIKKRQSKKDSED